MQFQGRISVSKVCQFVDVVSCMCFLFMNSFSFLLAMLALIQDDRFMKGPGKYVFWMRGAYFENQCREYWPTFGVGLRSKMNYTLED